jgi:hypothetical protein
MAGHRLTTDDVTGNMEIERLGLRCLTEDEQRLVDSHAERNDEVDWDQLQLSSIPEPAELDDVRRSRARYRWWKWGSWEQPR